MSNAPQALLFALLTLAFVLYTIDLIIPIIPFTQIRFSYQFLSDSSFGANDFHVMYEPDETTVYDDDRFSIQHRNMLARVLADAAAKINTRKTRKRKSAEVDEEDFDKDEHSNKPPVTKKKPGPSGKAKKTKTTKPVTDAQGDKEEDGENGEHEENEEDVQVTQGEYRDSSMCTEPLTLSLQLQRPQRSERLARERRRRWTR